MIEVWKAKHGVRFEKCRIEECIQYAKQQGLCDHHFKLRQAGQKEDNARAK